MAVARSLRVRINHGRTPCPRGHRRRTPALHRLAAAQRGQRRERPAHYDRAWIHIGTDEHRHLLIRRNRSTGERAYCICWSPATVTLAEPARVAGVRWSSEECFQAAKGQVGLDHYQVRHWTAWHRHITLDMLALAFLTALAANAAPQRPADPHHPARSRDPIKPAVLEKYETLVMTAVNVRS
ncbi:hypothetical protein ACFUTR_30605 [Streptomyces sp. NPDC057367]|uniref:hypothetical protein n=1 Tax=Streptomyces sp. NPDC057367 TaxID=3346108 RepID=UPI00362F2135